jgi:oligoendopeptidase F
MAETASMAMELLTMKYWDEYYKNPEDLSRAKREKLESTILFLPWCAVVDGIQQWVYTHPEHTADERDAEFRRLMKTFGMNEADWTGYADFMMNDFLMQSHIFQIPFYYLEYGIANLGALQVYRNAVKDEKTGLDAYARGLALGYSKPLPEIWKAMGIDFDFSSGKIQELMKFVGEELQK